MLRYFFLLLLTIHGLIHLIGFVNAWKLYSMKGFNGTTLVMLSETGVKIIGVVWLLCSILFLLASLAYGLHKEWWWVLALCTVVLSQVLIVIYWSDAKAGTLANALILIVAVVAFADWRFTNNVNAEVDALFQYQHRSGQRVEEAQLVTLPQPVQRWLQRSGVIGKEAIHSVRLKQEGLMRLKPSQQAWIKTNAVQYITIDKPAFIWRMKMEMMPLLPICGQDKYGSGHGQMIIKLFSLINMVNAADAKIDQGALQRWLAEICWYPSAALSPHIKWEGIGANSAKATLSDGSTSGSVTFFFTADGDLLRVEADRYMGSGKTATLEKWLVECKAYGSFNGVHIPVVCEVTWRLKNGDFTWYKLKITDMDFNLPQRY